MGCKYKRSQGECQYGCTQRVTCCHQFSRSGRCTWGDACRKVHCTPGFDAGGNLHSSPPRKRRRQGSSRQHAQRPPSPPRPSRAPQPGASSAQGNPGGACSAASGSRVTWATALALFGLPNRGYGDWPSTTEVNRAYRQIIRADHPDKNQGMNHGRAVEINTSRDILLELIGPKRSS